MSLRIVEATTEEALAACLAIRRVVFIEEQGVDEALEVDGQDSKATHLLAHLDGTPVGTLRIREVGTTHKVERVAVLSTCRGEGIGAALTRAAIARAIEEGQITEVKLGAQVPVIPFYEALGFTARGPVFDDAGIPHREMARPV